jgi:hypothetical protein
LTELGTSLGCEQATVVPAAMSAVTLLLHTWAPGRTCSQGISNQARGGVSMGLWVVGMRWGASTECGRLVAAVPMPEQQGDCTAATRT